MTTDYRYIGKSLGRAEGPPKARGEARYPGDLKLPGMLYGKCLRSPLPHARIVSIDTSEARRAPGVHAVVTALDLPHQRVGRFLRDFEPLAGERVLFVGQKVAAVAADTLDAAERALALIEVEYEELDAITNIDAALAPDAPVLHPAFSSYGGIVEGEQQHPNVIAEATWGKGDLAAAMATAAHVFEHTFHSGRQHQGYIEPHACLVDIEADGHVRVWANSKAPFDLRRQVAAGIEVEPESVTIMPSPIGGDFGGKGGFMDTHVAVALARASGRPVLQTMDYMEELTAGNPRHGGTYRFRTGVTAEGRIVAREALLDFDSGAFAAFRPGKGASYGPRCLGAYRMDASHIHTRMIYTNQVPCGSMRSPGDPQSVFAAEAHIDLVARALDMDPLEFRQMNTVGPDEQSPTGNVWRQPQARTLLDTAADRIGYANRPKRTGDGRARGMGLSVCERNTGGGICTAGLRIDPDGAVTLSISLRDTGSGFYTMLRQVVAEEIGVPFDTIVLDTWSTDALENDGGVGGARVTNAAGNAVLGACKAVRENVEGFLANRAGWSLGDIQWQDGDVIHGESRRSLAEVVTERGEPVEARFMYSADAVTDRSVFTAQAAEVAVDTETGEVEVLHFVTVHDVGEVLNPMAHQGQVDGGFVQGLGYALMEELVIEDGYVLNNHLGAYKMPTLRDMPPLTTVLVRGEEDGPAPYGGKGIGEQSVSGVAPAIVNAILDATGVSVRRIPVTAERMLDALDAAD